MARNKNRRQRRRGGRRRGNNKGGSRFRITIPAVFHVNEGKTETINAGELFPDKFWTGIPWRLLHIRVEATVKSTQEKVGTTNAITAIEPVILQVRMHGAGASNVEGVSSVRWTVSMMPSRRTIRMRAPNLWKEDEQRNQDLVALDNINLSGTTDTTVFCLINFTFEFGPISFDTKPSALRFFPADRLRDTASTSSAYSVL